MLFYHKVTTLSTLFRDFYLGKRFLKAADLYYLISLSDYILPQPSSKCNMAKYTKLWDPDLKNFVQNNY